MAVLRQERGLKRDGFDVRRETPEAAGADGRSWYGTLALAAIVPVVTYFPLNLLGQGFVPIGRLFPQQITNGVMVWALGNALVLASLFAVWHLRGNRGTDRERYGFGTGSGLRTIGKSFLGAVVITGGFYALLAAVGYLFDTGFRFWVFAVRLPSPMQLRIALVYLVPLALVFLRAGTAASRPATEGRTLVPESVRTQLARRRRRVRCPTRLPVRRVVLGDPVAAGPTPADDRCDPVRSDSHHRYSGLDVFLQEDGSGVDGRVRQRAVRNDHARRRNRYSRAPIAIEGYSSNGG